jgi:DNA-binding NtrC family response regulator
MKQAQKYPARPLLLVDDERAVLDSLSRMLAAGGIGNIMTCPESREVLSLVRRDEPSLLLLDLGLPFMTGEELLAELQAEAPHVPVIVVTGAGDIDTAVRCLQAGACDYMVKPVEESRLVSGVRRALEIRELKQAYGELKQRLLSPELRAPELFAAMVTRNRRMQSIFLYAEQAAKSSEPVLIRGETGTGKDLLARAVHAASGRRGELVAVNAAGLDHNLFADTLFGHKKGAFTGADTDREGLILRARGGTLFLDEIGDLDAASQVKLLTLLDRGEYYPLGADFPRRTDARFVLATNRDLDALLAADRFRSDLYYRLSTHEISLPPLRERRDDLPLLASLFAAEAASELKQPPPNLPPGLIPLLETLPLPGNIRELRKLMKDAVTRARGRRPTLALFKEALGGGFSGLPGGREAPGAEASSAGRGRPEEPLVFGPRLPTIRRATELLIAEALERAHGNQSLAASMLGISHQALSKRLKRRARE